MTKTKHTSSSGGVILNGTDIAVVSQHGKTWSLPKGHIENNETLLQTAYREIYEETGIKQLEFIMPLGSYSRYKIGKNPKEDDISEKKTLHFFLFKTTQRLLQSNDTDNPDVEWIPIDSVAKKLTNAKDKEFFNSIKPTLYGFSSTAITITTTFPTQQSATNCFEQLLEKKYASCCQLSPIHSLYYWNNKVQNDQEFKCSIKTNYTHLESCKAIILNQHPYDTPQFIVTPITYMENQYAQWHNSCIAEK